MAYTTDTVEIPVVYDGDAVAVMVCDLCGHILGDNTECRSSVHFGPTGSMQLVGHPILSTTLAERYRALALESTL